MQMNESPAFKKMKEEGTQSKAPLSEAFGQWKNAKMVIIALLGLVAGQAVVWYTGQFYALFFLQRSEEHTSELQSRQYLVCRLLLEKRKPQPRCLHRLQSRPSCLLHSPPVYSL